MSDEATRALPRLVLASGSPRRRELLEQLGLSFEVREVDIDERPRDGESAAELTIRLATEKATAAAAPGELVLAADTAVTIDGEILGKPGDAAEAKAMLARLAGAEHAVVTALAFVEQDRALRIAVAEWTRVVLRPMSEGEIAWYASCGEPMDKAGAYAVQGLAGCFVERIEGSYSNVVGLPISTLYRLCRRIGYELLAFRDEPPSAAELDRIAEGIE